MSTHYNVSGADGAEGTISPHNTHTRAQCGPVVPCICLLSSGDDSPQAQARDHNVIKQAIIITFTLDSCSTHLSSSSSTMSGRSIPNVIPSFSLGTHLATREVQQHDLHPGFFTVAVSYHIVPYHITSLYGGLGTLHLLGGGGHGLRKSLARANCEKPTTASTRHIRT